MNHPTEKICTKKSCPHKGQPQPITNFSKKKEGYKDGHNTWCIECEREYQRIMVGNKKRERQEFLKMFAV